MCLLYICNFLYDPNCEFVLSFRSGNNYFSCNFKLILIYLTTLYCGDLDYLWLFFVAMFVLGVEDCFCHNFYLANVLFLSFFLVRDGRMGGPVLRGKQLFNFPIGLCSEE